MPVKHSVFLSVEVHVSCAFSRYEHWSEVLVPAVFFSQSSLAFPLFCQPLELQMVLIYILLGPQILYFVVYVFLSLIETVGHEHFLLCFPLKVGVVNSSVQVRTALVVG